MDLCIQSVIVGGVILLIAPGGTQGNYRHLHVENTDICNEARDPKPTATSALEIGTGAVIIQLENPLKLQQDYRNKIKRCEIHLKAPPHFGLMVHVEQMNFRQSSKDKGCVDYLQFGKDDFVPFFTFEKSPRLCGETGYKNGATFDDPSGNLLIWVNLGGRRKTTYWPEISVVNLTLVVTAYQGDCGVEGVPLSTGFMNCGDRKKCIYQKYKCDRHINCATDNGTSIDEKDCVYEKRTGGPNDDLKDDDETTTNTEFGSPALNWITWVLILLSISLSMLLVITLCYKIQRKHGTIWFCCKRSLSGSCDFPEQAGIQSLAELSSQRHLYPTEQNIYFPLTTYMERPVGSDTADPHQAIQTENSFFNMTGTLPEEPPDFPEEPPPAYNELFPSSDELVATFPNEHPEPRETSEMLPNVQHLDGRQDVAGRRSPDTQNNYLAQII